MKQKRRVLASIFIIAFLFIFDQFALVIFSDRLNIFFSNVTQFGFGKFSSRIGKGSLIDKLQFYNRHVLYSDIDNFGVNKGPALNFIVGGGMCDSQNLILIKFLEKFDIKAYIWGLTWKSGQSHHTVAYVCREKECDPAQSLDDVYYVDLFYNDYFKDQNSNPLTVFQLCQMDLKSLKSYSSEPQNLFDPKAGETYHDNQIFCRKTSYSVPNIPNHEWGTLKKAMGDLAKVINLKPLFKLLVAYHLIRPSIPNLIYNQGEKIINSKLGEMSLSDKMFYLWARLDHIYLDLGPAVETYSFLKGKYKDNAKTVSILDEMECGDLSGEIVA